MKFGGDGKNESELKSKQTLEYIVSNGHLKSLVQNKRTTRELLIREDQLPKTVINADLKHFIKRLILVWQEVTSGETLRDFWVKF